MELFDMELEKAGKLIDAAGRERSDFSFKQTHLPPDPEDVVMFTARYEVLVSDAKSGKSLEAIGGIGLDWVGYFGSALEDGHFD
jgi:hypothetical protein